MLTVRVTYFAEAAPRSLRTVGLIKVGSSRNPDKRARSLSARVIGTTTLPELPLRHLLAPFSVPVREIKERGLANGGGASEWVYDDPAVRALAAWVCAHHPVAQCVESAATSGAAS